MRRFGRNETADVRMSRMDIREEGASADASTLTPLDPGWQLRLLRCRRGCCRWCLRCSAFLSGNRRHGPIAGRYRIASHYWQLEELIHACGKGRALAAHAFSKQSPEICDDFLRCSRSKGVADHAGLHSGAFQLQEDVASRCQAFVDRSHRRGCLSIFQLPTRDHQEAHGSCRLQSNAEGVAVPMPDDI